MQHVIRHRNNVKAQPPAATGVRIEDPEEVHGDCSTDDLVEPTSANFTFYDDPNDEWTEDRCDYDCTIVGGSGTIYYD